MKVFLDANILFSAANCQSPLHIFIGYLRHKATLITSAQAKTEVVRNIQRKRSAWHSSLMELLEHIRVIPDELLYENITLREKDRLILGTAIATGCDYLLTGDKRDFGRLYGKTVGGVKIVNYHMLMERLE